jgi:hypothetical protein
MKRLFGGLVFVFVYGLGFFAGHYYTAEKLAPSIIDFSFADKFTSLVDDELGKYQKSYSFDWRIKTTLLKGPVLDVSASDGSISDKNKFKERIVIREDIADKVLTFHANGLINEDLEKIRPLAKEVAKKIIEVQLGR